MPRVINLRNTHGKVPVGAVLIDRRTKWGNPFRVEVFGRKLAIELYRSMIQTSGLGLGNLLPNGELKIIQAEILADRWLARHDYEPLVWDLRGKDLACWCSPLPCHGDVLLELANA